MRDTSSPVALPAHAVWAYSKCINFILTSMMILKLFLHRIFDGSKEPLGHLIFYCQLIYRFIEEREGKCSPNEAQFTTMIRDSWLHIWHPHPNNSISCMWKLTWIKKDLRIIPENHFFPSDLLRNDCHITLCKFKVYNMSNWYTYILQNDYQCS